MKIKIVKGDDIKVQICEYCNEEHYPYEDGDPSSNFYTCIACGTEACDHCKRELIINGVEFIYHRKCKVILLNMKLAEFKLADQNLLL